MPISIRDNVMEGAYQRQIAERLLVPSRRGRRDQFIQDAKSPGGHIAFGTPASHGLLIA